MVFYPETATLLDVVAGRDRTVWARDAEPGKAPYFRDRLRQLLVDLKIQLSNKRLSSIIHARNSLVHAGKFVTSEHDLGPRATRQRVLRAIAWGVRLSHEML